jgi:PilZ domain
MEIERDAPRTTDAQSEPSRQKRVDHCREPNRGRRTCQRTGTFFACPGHLALLSLAGGRVDFERGIPVYMMGIDGTWRRDCMMIDVSQTGARLLVEGSLEGLDLKEFFLLLSSTGLAYRRCQLVRVAGDQIGVAFLARDTFNRNKSAKNRSTDQAV